MDINYSYYNTSNGYKVVGGTAVQFLKADGSVDSNSYLTANDKVSQVGARNLITNSKNYWLGNSDAANSNNSIQGEVTITGSGFWNAYAGATLNDYTPGSSLTYQIEIKHNNSAPIVMTFYFYNNGDSQVFTQDIQPNVWTKITRSSSPAFTTSILMGVGGTGTDIGTKVQYRNLQVEEGKIPTTYRPAHEDFVSPTQLNDYWKIHIDGQYKGVNSDKPFALLNNQQAQRLYAKEILASDYYTDAQYIPLNGIFSQGNIRTFGQFIGNYFASTHLLGNQIINAYGNTLTLGNPGLPQLNIETGNSDLLHYRDGHGTGVIWDQHNFNPNDLIPKAHPVYSIQQYQINNWRQFDGYWDNRQIQPAHIAVNHIQHGFTSWNNDSTDPWADYIHFGGYSDGSGGLQNLITFKKNGFGMRQWQGSHQGVVPYQSYVEYWNTGHFTETDLTNFKNLHNNLGSFNPASYVQQSNLNTQLSAALNGYATQGWVQSLGYITASALNGYATQNWVTQQSYLTAANLNGYATQAWVQSLGYITASALNGYATQSYVGQTFIPQTHPVNNITQTNINTWNNLASYTHQHSNYSLLEVINQELATNSEVDFARVIVEDYVKAQNNFMSADEEPDTMFIPDGNTATLRDEIINDDYQIRLNPHEYNVDGSGYLEIIDRNRLIHVIGEQIKMVINLKEVFSKQEFVIYNFDPAGNSMLIQVQGNNVASIDPGCFRRLYVTEASRVIAERQQQCDFIW